ncbi:MAG TPA: hypothetical protein VKX25_06975 [Bryobacteraceae bacterium]|jgi:hypothetical protein|nr:hypothetical protein [Bryobacteraceae bacterium]
MLLGASFGFADPISFVTGYVGSYLIPGPGYSVSYTSSGSSSYHYSEVYEPGDPIATYTASEQTSGTLTTVGVQVSNAWTGFGVQALRYASTNSFAGAILKINQAVYLSETATVNWTASVVGRTSSSTGWESVDFADMQGTEIGSTCHVFLAPNQSAQTCSTGKVLIGAGSEIAVNNSLVGSVLVQGVGESATFQGTAELGPLQVYDLNGNLIESFDLGAMDPAPEPDLAIVCGVALAGLIYRRKFVTRSRRL